MPSMTAMRRVFESGAKNIVRSWRADPFTKTLQSQSSAAPPGSMTMETETR